MGQFDRYYKILGIEAGASETEIKQAYRQLAKIWHPDCFPHDPELRKQAEARIKELNEAYQVLKGSRSNIAQPDIRAKSTPTSKVYAKENSSAEAFYREGAEKVKQSQYQEAIQDFTAAIRSQPTYAEAYRFRGFVYSLLGYEYQANSDLQQAKKLELNQSIKSNQPRSTTQSASTTQATSRHQTQASTSSHSSAAS